MLKKKVKKFAMALVTTLVVTLGLTVGSATTASASSLSDCDSGDACIYSAAGHVGTMEDFGNLLHSFGPMNNRASSVYNHGVTCSVTFYSQTYRDGYRFTLAKNHVVYDLANKRMGTSGDWDNTIASGYFCE